MTSGAPFTVRRESGSDYAVIDRHGIVKVSGLFEDEAEQTATAWNKEAAAEKETFCS